MIERNHVQLGWLLCWLQLLRSGHKLFQTWISAPSMSRLSKLTVALPTARRRLMRLKHNENIEKDKSLAKGVEVETSHLVSGKHWNFWVSSPSFATTPAIPPSVAFKEQVWNDFWIGSSERKTHQAQWSAITPAIHHWLPWKFDRYLILCSWGKFYSTQFSTNYPFNELRGISNKGW